MRPFRIAALLFLVAGAVIAQDEPFEARVLVKTTSAKAVVVLIDTLPADGRLNKAFRARADDPFKETAAYAFDKAKVTVHDNDITIVSDADKLVVALTMLDAKVAEPPAGYRLLRFSGYEVARELGPFTDAMPKDVSGVAALAKTIFGDE